MNYISKEPKKEKSLGREDRSQFVWEVCLGLAFVLSNRKCFSLIQHLKFNIQHFKTFVFPQIFADSRRIIVWRFKKLSHEKSNRVSKNFGLSC
jgi:hypothetical protein